jgi:hypothetical protein
VLNHIVLFRRKPEVAAQPEFERHRLHGESLMMREAPRITSPVRGRPKTGETPTAGRVRPLHAGGTSEHAA